MRAAWLGVLLLAGGCNQIFGITDVIYRDGGIPVDAPKPPDADPPRPDADPAVPDANPVVPDADPGLPDAPAPLVDAPIGPPDSGACISGGTQCSDCIDNDSDGLTDFGASGDPQCVDAADDDEST